MTTVVFDQTLKEIECHCSTAKKGSSSTSPTTAASPRTSPTTHQAGGHVRVRVPADGQHREVAAPRQQGDGGERLRRRRGSTRATSAATSRSRRFFAGAKEQFGTIDFLVHSLAFANRDYLKKDEGIFTTHAARGVQAGGGHQRVQPDRASTRAAAAAHARRRVDHRPDLPRQREGHPRLQRDGRRQGGAGIDGALPRVRPGQQEDPRQHDLAPAR